MAKRLRDSGGRVFLHCEQLATRKGFTSFDSEEEFETVEAKPKRRKKKVAKKAAEPAPAAEAKTATEKAPEGLEDWE